MEKNKIIFVIKTFDKMSDLAEYLFLSQQDYFIDSVSELELNGKTYANAIKVFKIKNPEYQENYNFIITDNSFESRSPIRICQ